MHGHTLLARALVVVTLFLVVAGAVGALIVYSLGKTAPLQDTQGLTRITVAGTAVFVKIAETPQTQALGLSGTPSLASNQGMLFVFDRDDYYHIWMKDMQYGLDILWISEQGVIVHIEKSVSPDTYPKAYTSDVPARMVLEVPAGFTDRHGVTDGERVTVY